MKRLWAFVLISFLISCVNLPYKDDTGFIVSAQADSPEFPVYVNGTLCKDMDGEMGLCSKRLPSNEALTLHFDAQSYVYLLTVACTNPLTVPSATVPSGSAYDVVIQPSQFPVGNGFICIGEVFPQDRNQVSAKFEVRVVLMAQAYQAREQMMIIKKGSQNYLVLGEFARDAWVFDQKWSKYSKATYVALRSDPSAVQAYSSSFQMRFNSYNLRSPVP